MESDGDETRVFGLSVEDAVEALADRDDDRETRQAVLRRVAEDGTVTPAGVDNAVGRVSKYVATPETRLELAEDALAEVREDAEDVADVGAVRSRLDAFERRRESVAERLASVQSDLQAVVERADDPADVYALAREVGEIQTAAKEVHRTADELAIDADDFGRWLDDAGHRYREFNGDLVSLEGVVDDLGADPAGADEWLDATLRRRVLALLTADLRSELADLERLADEGDAPPAEYGDRLDAIGAQLASAEDDLEAAARPDWRDRYGEQVADFEDAIADLSPPVPWDEAWARYEEAALE
jgi:chromosome segregation ATPase